MMGTEGTQVPDRQLTRAERLSIKRNARQAIFQQLQARPEMVVLPARPGSNVKVVRRFYFTRRQMRALAKIQVDALWKDLKRMAKEKAEHVSVAIPTTLADPDAVSASIES